jgi:tyrosyl-tRNA synthetase
MVEVAEQMRIIKRGVLEIIEEEELKQKLEKSCQTNTPLKIKVGVDPSMPDIHLGHTVPLRKLRQFQDLGHRVVFIIGDFTGMIGDPSGKSKTRKLLTSEEVKKNAQTYQEQIFKILNAQKTEVVFNSQWFNQLKFAEIIKLASLLTLSKLLEHGTFRERYQQNKDISLIEFIYPLIQGYDSVKVKADVEIGGSDQRFNLLIGRAVQRHYGLSPQVIITLPLLEGTDGREKMSKSLNNYIGINEPPSEIFGKVMSIPDELMFKYYELLTPFSLAEIEKFKKGWQEGTYHPKKIKEKLAFKLVEMYHSYEKATQAQAEFHRVFAQRGLPDQIPEFKIRKEKVWVIELLSECQLVSSRSEGRRMIEQKAVSVDGVLLTDTQAQVLVKDGMVLKVGKRRFARLKKEK